MAFQISIALLLRSEPHNKIRPNSELSRAHSAHALPIQCARPFPTQAHDQHTAIWLDPALKHGNSTTNRFPLQYNGDAHFLSPMVTTYSYTDNPSSLIAKKMWFCLLQPSFCCNLPSAASCGSASRSRHNTAYCLKHEPLNGRARD